MTEHTITISSDGGDVTARLAGEGKTGILLAHGAGTSQDHPFLGRLRDSLAGAGHLVMTFNYVYAERGSKRPDAPGKLLAVHRAAADTLGAQVDRLILAGRSMGGRMATYLVAEGYPADGVILYAYPLHPAGREDRLRVEHFPEVVVPLLFFQGTRDALSRMPLFEQHIRPMPNATVEILEGADHSFRGGGWTEARMVDHLAEVSSLWIRTL
jgi:uncharacterized protein